MRNGFYQPVTNSFSHGFKKQVFVSKGLNDCDRLWVHIYGSLSYNTMFKFLYHAHLMVHKNYTVSYATS